MKSILKNEAGFTLIEMLTSLMISSVIILLLVAGINQAFFLHSEMIVSTKMQRKNTYVGDRQIEWHLFLNQIESHLQDSRYIAVGKSEIHVEEWEEESNKHSRVIYRSPGTNLSQLSRIRNNGNQIMLTGITAKEFSRDNKWLNMEVTFQNGEHYTASIYVESWAEE